MVGASRWSAVNDLREAELWGVPGRTAPRHPHRASPARRLPDHAAPASSDSAALMGATWMTWLGRGDRGSFRRRAIPRSMPAAYTFQLVTEYAPATRLRFFTAIPTGGAPATQSTRTTRRRSRPVRASATSAIHHATTAN